MKTKSKKSSQTDFFTRQRANEGIKLPLSTPDGQETEHWLQIRGVDSDAYKLANADSKRRIFALATETAKPDLSKVQEHEINVLLSVLVIAWSFDEPCTPENVQAFLKEAPQIAEQIDRISMRRALFFAESLKPSTPSPAPTSS